MTHLASFLTVCLSASVVFSQRCPQSVTSWDSLAALHQVIPYMRYVSQHPPKDKEKCLFFDVPFSYPHSKTKLRSNTYGAYNQAFQKQGKRRMYALVEKNMVKVLNGVFEGTWNLLHADLDTCIVTHHEKRGLEIWVRHDRPKPYDFNACCMFRFLEEVESDASEYNMGQPPIYQTPYEDQKCRTLKG
uniref:Putative salivary protein n=1 Tax=Ornithodoros parkeri TaxID=140564 RepID=A6N9P4_ORNPR|nr:putative salivary protein [Ornithodoros parkeri]